MVLVCIQLLYVQMRMIDSRFCFLLNSRRRGHKIVFQQFQRRTYLSIVTRVGIVVIITKRGIVFYVFEGFCVSIAVL